MSLQPILLSLIIVLYSLQCLQYIQYDMNDPASAEMQPVNVKQQICNLRWCSPEKCFSLVRWSKGGVCKPLPLNPPLDVLQQDDFDDCVCVCVTLASFSPCLSSFPPLPFPAVRGHYIAREVTMKCR